ncbi:MAG: benzoyl-CoA-dihydrodiol lyase, partial [Gammaproteobacteria bacterium]|nr:benzoyl-CoA-dihydrodiol lyase [Gammaproteobacteria bacterium]
DGSAAVSLPEVPLLAVLPGTGGLTRLVDKRKVRRDLADVFCTLEEGVRGRRAVEWRLVDETVPNSRFVETVKTRAAELAAGSDRPAGESGIVLTPLDRKLSDGRVDYSHIGVMLDPQLRVATITLKGPADGVPESIEQIKQQGAAFWPLTLVRELDDALLHLRTNESETCTLVFKTRGEVEAVAAYERILQSNAADWFVREIILYWKRTFKRIDMTSRSTLTLVDQGSCFSGLLAELVFAADRTYMLEGKLEDDERPEAALQLSAFNFGLLPMSNGLTRLQTRFLGEPESLGSASRNMGESLDAVAALDAGLVTFAPDDIDWQDEIRLLLEERASFSPDALTGMEANLRFAGPETMETKIFGRLTAWQNWIFQRPNAVSDGGALRLYGSGVRPEFNKQRV